MWTDTHCHLTDAAFDADREAVIASALAAGVDRIIVIGCARDQFEPVLDLTGRHQGLYPVLGLHPDSAGERDAEDLEALRRVLAEHPVRALGEIGLDYHWEPAKKTLQRRLFERQLELAEELRLPVAIHERDAFDDVLAILGGTSQPVLLHCFSHGRPEAKRALDAGYMLALGGAATFRSASELRETAMYVPTDRLVLETDAPYLTPHPHRGTRNEPRYVALTGNFVAEMRDLDAKDLAGRTTANSVRFFGGMDPLLPSTD